MTPCAIRRGCCGTRGDSPAGPWPAVPRLATETIAFRLALAHAVQGAVVIGVVIAVVVVMPGAFKQQRRRRYEQLCSGTEDAYTLLKEQSCVSVRETTASQLCRCCCSC